MSPGQGRTVDDIILRRGMENERFTTRPELKGSVGMVASTHWLASGVGMRMLELGGNAFDAAVAAGFVLHVVEPHQNGPGGDLPAIFWNSKLGEPKVLCAQGPAPKNVSIARFRELGLDTIPANGLLPAVVPGAFDGWMLLLRDFGTLRLRDVLEPAIYYAEHGYPASRDLALEVEAISSFFEDEWTSSAAVWLVDGGPRADQLFRTPKIASTWRRVVDEAEAAASDRDAQIDTAREVFYRGFVAEAIDRFYVNSRAMDISGERHGGFLTGADLAGWSASYEEPLTYEYSGVTVCKAGPWSQGPVFLQQLALLDGFDLDSMDPGSAEYIHTVIECAKLAFADRETWYGDPRFADVPMGELLSPAYNSQRRRLVDTEASMESRPGCPEGSTQPTPGRRQDGHGALRAAHGNDTCHVSVADRFGNMIAATPSGGWLRGAPVVPDLGFSVSTRGQIFWLDEGHPNALGPGRRPRTTLSPTLTLRDGSPYSAFGTPGGDFQDQWSLQFFLAYTHYVIDLQLAIDEPKFHTSHFASSFYPRTAQPGRAHMERRVPGAVIDELRERGHDVTLEPEWALGRIAAVARDEQGLLRGGADARGMMRYAVGR